MSVNTHYSPARAISFTGQLLSGLFLLVALTATAQSNWNVRPQGFRLSAITYKGSRFVAVGANNSVATSTNGTTWQKSLAGTAQQLNGVAAGSATLGVVAVGNQGIIIGSTTEGLSWSVQASGTANDLMDVAYGAGVYVAVGKNGIILTSPDGSTWTAHTSGTSLTLLGVYYGGGQFTAVGMNGAILTSINGTYWVTRTSNTVATLQDVAYGNGKYVVVGVSFFGGTTNATLTSPDGVTWTGQYPASGTDYPLYGITFGNGQFVSVGLNGTVLTSTNGTIWTARDAGLDETLQGVAYAYNQFVVVGNSIRTSTNGTAWQATSAPDGESNPYGIAYGNGRYVAVGIGITYNPTLFTPTAAMVSTDGITFTRSEAGNYGGMSAVTYAYGMFVAVGYKCNIITSLDGITWTLRSGNASTGGFNAIEYGNGRFVAVGSNGAAAVSTNGTSWTATSMGTTESFNDLTYGFGLFVAVGPNGAIRTSTNGVTWTARTSNSTTNLTGIAYGNGTFVAVGYAGGSVRRSTDGITWTGTDNSSGVNAGKITFGNGLFVIANASGSISTTPNGLNPVPKTSNTYSAINAIEYVNFQFMGVSPNATVLSAPVDPMPFSISGATLFSCDLMRAGSGTSPELRAVRFAPNYAGTFTPPMSFSVTGLLAMTTNPDAIIYPTSDMPTVTIVARDAQGRTASFVWNWLARCGNGVGARLGAEPEAKLAVVVLGNPTRQEAVEVEISGAADQSVSLEVVNAQGMTISQHTVERAGTTERQRLRVGDSAGLYLLTVHTATQAQTVKLIKQ